MAATRYELRIYRERREVQAANRITEVLDLDPQHVPTALDVLDRHLIAAAARDGHPDEPHLYHLEVRPVERDGSVRTHEPALTRAMPVRGDWRWR